MHLALLRSMQCGRRPDPLSLDTTFVYDLDNLYVTAPTISSEHGVDINAQVYIIDAQTTPQEHMSVVPAILMTALILLFVQ